MSRPPGRATTVNACAVDAFHGRSTSYCYTGTNHAREAAHTRLIAPQQHQGRESPGCLLPIELD
ncbi:hypothetical protein E2C01_076438 [Portunus trituberculatus]|uniref:Uncharacterized protein n=1 Tax=Portunus trituberculatus TaxID=210409 RepID=A0A5B7IHN4_PORTR|nr:hypothetical protein [Portunus trituberculatus]